MNHTNFSHVFEAAQNGNSKDFNHFFAQVKQKCQPKLLQLTKSQFDADEVFAQVLLKFWERFVEGKQELPSQNIEGYIYRMCINAFHNMQRKRKNERVDYKEEFDRDISEGEHKSDEDLWEELITDEVKHTSLRNAIANLCQKCKTLYTYLINGEKLKNIWEELGYKNYQGIVQAKYNCKKELKRKFFVELNKPSN